MTEGDTICKGKIKVNSVVRDLVSVFRISDFHRPERWCKLPVLSSTVKLVDKEEWIKVKGTHEPLKTEKEHDLILAKIAQNNFIPQKILNGKLPLSGLLYCAKCGHAMQFRRYVGKKEIYWSAVCVHTYPDGTKCNQKGRKLDAAFYKALYSTIIKIDEQSLEMIDETNDQYSEAETLLEMRQNDLSQAEEAIEKLFELYEDGTISKQRFTDRIAIYEKNKKEAQEDVEKYRHLLAASADILTVDTIQEKVNEFKQLWSKAATSNEKNKAYRLLIDKIIYDREDNGVTLEVLYK